MHARGADQSSLLRLQGTCRVSPHADKLFPVVNGKGIDILFGYRLSSAQLSFHAAALGPFGKYLNEFLHECTCCIVCDVAFVVEQISRMADIRFTRFVQCQVNVTAEFE